LWIVLTVQNKICNGEMIDKSIITLSLKSKFSPYTNTNEPVLGSALTGQIAEILPINYSYIIDESALYAQLYGQREQGKNIEIKKPHSELYIYFTHNHAPKSSVSLSFRPVSTQKEEKYLKLFQCGHIPSTACYEYEAKLHLSAGNEKDLAAILADRAINPDSEYIIGLIALYRKFRTIQLGAQNGNNMFERLESEVKKYNELWYGKAVFCLFGKKKGQAFVLCIVSNLMRRIHEII
ncbi:1963_t:CDS:2, partial [Gigaspora margarita]